MPFKFKKFGCIKHIIKCKKMSDGYWAPFKIKYYETAFSIGKFFTNLIICFLFFFKLKKNKSPSDITIICLLRQLLKSKFTTSSSGTPSG